MESSKYEALRHVDVASFQRLTGVRPEVFLKMCAVLKDREAGKRKSGRPAALCIEDQVLLTLEFWREYRTLFHLGVAWNMHESTVQRTVNRVESALIDSSQFRLPSRQSLRHTVYTAVIVDVSEVPCERPKKKNGAGTAAKRNAIP